MMQWQQELVSIAAPPFGESKRAEWLAERFRELRLEQVEIDSEGNVLGCYPGNRSRSRTAMRHAVGPHRHSISAPHSDCSVGGAQSPGSAGACDNGAGVAGLLAVAAALESCGIELPCDLLFAGNVGEEGEGDLRGMRYLYGASPWRETHWRQCGARRRGVRGRGHPGVSAAGATWSP